MLINNLVLIHYNVEEPELLKSSFKNSYVILYKNQTIDEIINEINVNVNINNITNLALVFHPISKYYVPFFLNSQESELNIFSNEMVNFINNININKNLKIDLLACEMDEPYFKEKVKEANNTLNVNIRYSLDNTGNKTNWVLESENVDVEDYYFNENIKEWNHNLRFNIGLSSGNNLLYYKVISGNAVRTYLNVDISGNPLNPIYDNNGRNNKFEPSRIIMLDPSAISRDPNNVNNFINIKNNLTNIVAVMRGRGYFALKSDGKVLFWSSYSDSNLTTTAFNTLNNLTNVVGLYSTGGALTAMTSTGNAFTWGTSDEGGGSSVNGTNNTNVSRVYATTGAFCGLLSSSYTVRPGYSANISTWGSSGQSTQTNKGFLRDFQENSNQKPAGYGPLSQQFPTQGITTMVNNVRTVANNDWAFTAIRSDGRVVSWGGLGWKFFTIEKNSNYGWDTQDIQSSLTNVRAILGTPRAFCALKSDGTVIAWGDYLIGGSLSYGPQDNVYTNIKELYSNTTGFTALKNDNTVIGWGSNAPSSADAPNLTNVATVYSTSTAWAALKKDGTVFTWGSSLGGGNSSSVQSELINVKAIYATNNAFAALRTDRTVVTWGNSNEGGDSSLVQGQLTDIVNIVANGRTFCAIKSDKSVVIWGHNKASYDGLQSELYNINGVYGFGYNDDLIFLRSMIDLFDAPTNIVITPNITTITVTYTQYTTFVPNQILLTGNMSNLTPSFLPSKSNYSEGFILTNLTPSTLYSGTFVLKNNNSESRVGNINHTTLDYFPPENIVTTTTVNTMTVVYDLYTIFTPNQVILSGDLSGDLSGLTVSLLPTKSNYAEGFIVSGLIPSTTYNGSFKLKNPSFETIIANAVGRTLDPPLPTNITFTADINELRVDYSYNIFTPNQIVLTSDLSGLTVDFLPNESNYVKGFKLVNLTPQTNYSGTIKLKNGHLETPIFDLSLTTLNPSAPTNKSLNVDILEMTITYDDYNFYFIPNEVILNGDLSGLTIEYLPDKTDYESGFKLVNLSPATTYVGSYRLKNGNLETVIIDFSGRTLKESDSMLWDSIGDKIKEIRILEDDLLLERRRLIDNKRNLKNILIDLSNNFGNANYPVVDRWIDVSNLEGQITNNFTNINTKIANIIVKRNNARTNILQVRNNVFEENNLPVVVYTENVNNQNIANNRDVINKNNELTNKFNPNNVNNVVVANNRVKLQFNKFIKNFK